MIKTILQNGQRTGMTMREITELTDLKQHQVDFQMQKLIKAGEVIKSEDRIDGAYLYSLADYSPTTKPVVECSPVRLDNVIKHLAEKKADMVNAPAHYTSGKVECIDAIESMLSKDEFIGFLRGNILKYQWRYKIKNGVEDLKKAQWYFDKLKELEIKDGL